MGLPTGAPRGRALLVAVVAALVALAPAVGSAEAAKVTFIGDSSAAGIELSPRAKRLLARGHDMRRDLKVCRRLVAKSCPHNGVTPRTALQAVRFYGTSLGTVLVVDVGYNDSSATYRRHMTQVITAARARGVKGIVWVNLTTRFRSDYARINSIIASVARQRPIVKVANWNAYSSNKPSWFTNNSEQIHLTGAGAVALVRLVRQHIPLAAQGAAARPAVDAGADSAGPQAATTASGDEAEPANVQLTASSPPVGPNLGGPDGNSTVSGFVPFLAGTALMLFLVLVTVKRRRAA